MNIIENEFEVSFRCYYAGCLEPTRHYQVLKLGEIPRWIEAYKFTHPACVSISIKLWFDNDK